ncbi:hypothetical protein DEU56DRAFT_721884 [Suillus clintonianus]|uniref:uncharacterized protein n=1 Tax=Suillus clintonianus TaxID=1904413 RepID=UPI001B863D36|nr:uncharacterized protein DEU56DRAFT_721884 [Suillus clintonianus]KAG2157425.1 hypothetical protein DEU56DRAFT_721884 [Suillus clintonianus]
MVKLTLVSPKGNHGVRFFPCTGYLGLTPLKFEGVVRTEIEQDGKHLPAKDITVFVRCYEFRHGRLGTVQTNILVENSVTLWKKPDGQDWAEIGNTEYPFRLSMPLHTTGPSTALYFQEYRICWRIEAVVNHAPIPGVGSRLLKHYDLYLIRHDLPGNVPPPSPVTPPPTSYLSSLSTKSRAPSLHYRILLPTKPVGPLDIVSLQVTVQPLDPAVSIRSATAVVERRIQFSELPISSPGTSTSSAPTLSPHSYLISNQESHSHDHQSVAAHSSDIMSAASSSNDLHHFSSSSSLVSDTRPLLPQHQSSVPSASPSTHTGERTATHIFAHLESSHRFARDSTGTWRQTLTFSWPDASPSSRWTVGETVQTDMVSIKFFIRVKLIVSSPNSSAETVELDDKEIIVVSTNEAQRQLALSRYSAASQSKSRSPKRSKRDRPNTNTQLPSPPRSPPSVAQVPEKAPNTSKGGHEPEISLEHKHKFSSASSPQPGSKYKLKSTRRPHTSAGPRDTPHGYDSRGYDPLHDHSNRLPVPLRPETAYSGPATKRGSRSVFNQKWVEAPRLGHSSTSVSSEGAHSAIPESAGRAEGSLLFEKVGQVEMRAWEEELARIELVSRRSTADMMGFVSQRRKMTGQQVIRTYVHAEG